MAEELKRVEREFQIVKQSSSDIVDEEGERERRLSSNVRAKTRPFRRVYAWIQTAHIDFYTRICIFFCFRCASIVVYKKSLGGVVAVVEKP